MRALDWFLLLGLVAVEATLIYVCLLALAKWLDVRQQRIRQREVARLAQENTRRLADLDWRLREGLR